MEAFAEQNSPSVEVQEIVQALVTLPTEKIREVRDYVWFLQTRYSAPGVPDTDDVWSDEDLADVVKASLTYASQSVWGDENGSAR